MVKIDKNTYIGTGVCEGIYKIYLDSMLITPYNNGFYGRIILSFSSDSSALLASSYYFNTSFSQNSGHTWIDIFERENVNAYACLIRGSDLYIGTNGDGIFYKKSNTSDEFEKQPVEIDPDKYLDIKNFETIGRYTIACGGNEVVCRKADGESVWKRCNNGITPKDYFSDICENTG